MSTASDPAIVPYDKNWTWVLHRRCDECGFDVGSVDRTGRRSDGSEFTVESFALYFLHDPVHHLVDVGIDPGPTGARR